MLLRWHDGMSVNVDVIDDEHKQFIAFINNLHDAIEQNNGDEILFKSLSDTRAYADYHFKNEEFLFSQTDYPDKDRHKAQHRNIQATLANISKKFHDGD